MLRGVQGPALVRGPSARDEAEKQKKTRPIVAAAWARLGALGARPRTATPTHTAPTHLHAPATSLGRLLGVGVTRVLAHGGGEFSVFPFFHWKKKTRVGEGGGTRSTSLILLSLRRRTRSSKAWRAGSRPRTRANAPPRSARTLHWGTRQHPQPDRSTHLFGGSTPPSLNHCQWTRSRRPPPPVRCLPLRPARAWRPPRVARPRLSKHLWCSTRLATCE